MLQIDWGYYSLILNFDIRRRLFHLEKKKKKRFLFAFRSLIRNFAHMNEELFRTIVPLPEAPFRIGAAEQVLCIGSCFADEIGRRFQDDHFPTVANPFGVMYNPASILHTIQSLPRPLQKEGRHAINDDKIIVGGGDDRIITIITISKDFINKVKIDFECYGICSFEEKGIFLVCGKSNDISVYRSDNFSKIFNYNKAHNGCIYGLCKMNNGLIISYSGDNNNKNSIKIWFL